MNLLEVRQQFRTISGRYDLVNSDGSDNGADFYINEGSRYLDRLEYVPKSPGYYYYKLLSGHYVVTIPSCRAVQEAWVGNSTSRWQLEKKSFQWLREEYAQVFLQSDTGNPLYYAPINTRNIPAPDELGGDDVDIMGAMMDVVSTNNLLYNGIIVLPRTSSDIYVEVGGLFYQKELVNDDDENYWTQLSPFLLIQSAMLIIEMSNRNRQGVADAEDNIRRIISRIGMDSVEEDIAEYDQMEG